MIYNVALSHCLGVILERGLVYLLAGPTASTSTVWSRTLSICLTATKHTYHPQLSTSQPLNLDF